MQRLLIILGLVIVPFYEILLRAFPFVRNMSPDSRAPKEILALVFALSIGLLAVFQGNIKPFRNKWFLFIPIYLLFNLIIAPHSDLFINNVESGDLYFWKPFSEVLCFSLMIIAISSISISFEEIIKVMVICGAVMAGYVILQKLGFDQFWVAKTEQNFTAVREHTLGGNLGQPTIVSSWIVMIIPLAIHLRKYFMGLIMSIAVFLTGSAMAIGSLILMVSIYLIRINKNFFFIFLIMGIFIIGCLYKYPSFRQYVVNRMDGRYDVWRDTYKDIRQGPIDNGGSFSLTGVGLGRFSYIFPERNRKPFQQAHNDFLEFTYDCGIFGLIILLTAIFNMLCCKYFSGIHFSIMLSFVLIMFCSLGSFPFQLGAHQFYSAILVGLLNNDSIIKGGFKC